MVIRKLGPVFLRASGREPLAPAFPPPRIHSGGIGGWHPEYVVEWGMGASALVRAFLAAQLQSKDRGRGCAVPVFFRTGT